MLVKISTGAGRVRFGVGEGGCVSMFSKTFDESMPFDMVFDNSGVTI